MALLSQSSWDYTTYRYKSLGLQNNVAWVVITMSSRRQTAATITAQHWLYSGLYTAESTETVVQAGTACHRDAVGLQDCYDIWNK